MDTSNAPVYVCPMHGNIRERQPGRCPECGMNLVPEGTRFKFVRHMLGSPAHVVIMATIMIAVMAMVMMMMR